MSRNQPQSLWFSTDGLKVGRIVRWNNIGRHFGYAISKGPDGMPEEFFIHRNAGYFIRPVADHLEWVPSSFPDDVLPEPRVGDQIVFIASDEKPEEGNRRPAILWAFEKNYDWAKEQPLSATTTPRGIIDGKVLKYPFHWMSQGFFNVNSANDEVFFDQNDHGLPTLGADGSVTWTPSLLDYAPRVGTGVKFIVIDTTDRNGNPVLRAKPWCLETEWSDAQIAAKRASQQAQTEEPKTKAATSPSREVDFAELHTARVAKWNLTAGEAEYWNGEATVSIMVWMANGLTMAFENNRLVWKLLPAGKGLRPPVRDERIVFVESPAEHTIYWTRYTLFRRMLTEMARSGDVEMRVFLQHSDREGKNPFPAHLEWGGTNLEDRDLRRVWDPDPRHDSSHYVHDDFVADKWFEMFVNGKWVKLDFDPRTS
ncbi:hypothetical protein M1116_02480 [Patescibacteria group bacterium]|nr:hypothetical protein [Patescibacteria group bacterium]